MISKLTDSEIANWAGGRPSNPTTEQGVRMALEIQELRTRCLCRGSFRCTPCLEEMEADGIHAAEVDETRGDMLRTLELLRLLPVHTAITCHQCGGGSPEPEFCGCGGKQTVGEAIRWYESQLEILSK